MHADLEQAKQVVSQLPAEDFHEFDRWFETQKQNKARNAEKDAQLKLQLERFHKAQKWLAENSEKYMNKWVCLEGDKLIAVDDDGKTVYQKAKDAGIEIPFIHHVVDESMPFGGW